MNPRHSFPALLSPLFSSTLQSLVLSARVYRSKNSRGMRKLTQTLPVNSKNKNSLRFFVFIIILKPPLVGRVNSKSNLFETLV